MAEASYEKAQQDANPAKREAAQLNEFFTTADGREMSIAQLRGNIVAELAVSEGVLASTLEKTGLWKVSQDKVETTVDTGLELQILKQSIPLLSERISKICGRTMMFVVTQKQEEKKEEEKEQVLPDQVNVLLNAFKGTVV